MVGWSAGGVGDRGGGVMAAYDWRGTEMRAGSRVVWVVDNSRVVEGEVVMIVDHESVVCSPLYRSSQCVGSPPKRSVHPSPERPQTVRRQKVTVIS